MTRSIFVALILALLAAASQAIELAYSAIKPADSKSNAILLSGQIKKGDFEVLRQFAAKDKHRFHSRTVVLASPGGDLLEAMKIGLFLRKTFMTVFVNPEHGRCASACFFIYVAAIERDTVELGLGIHRPYFSAIEFERMPLQKVEERNRQLMEMVKRYLEDQQVPADLIERMFSLASSEIYWLTDADTQRIGRRAHWWDQLLVDRCQLDKSLESEFVSYGDRSPRAAQARRHIHEVALCGYKLSKDEGMKSLDQQLRSAK